MKQASAKKTTSKPLTSKNRLASPSKKVSVKEDFYQKVKEVAYQLYVERGCVHGYDVEDWAKAEKIVRGS